MERTLETMEEELALTIEWLAPLQSKLNELTKEIERYKLENALYHPMSELVDYKGKHISSITLVERDKDGELDTEYMYNDEIFEVTEDGHLYYSSYSGGIMSYDAKAEQYVHMYYGCPEYHDYVGFTAIDIDDYDEY